VDENGYGGDFVVPDELVSSSESSSDAQTNEYQGSESDSEASVSKLEADAADRESIVERCLRRYSSGSFNSELSQSEKDMLPKVNFRQRTIRIRNLEFILNHWVTTSLQDIQFEDLMCSTLASLYHKHKKLFP
jgi:hypothetical protein